jgi:hypothetical protein
VKRLAPPVLLLACLFFAPAVRADAAAGISTVNMPPGWTWPPSVAMVERGERCIRELSATGLAFQRVASPVGKIVAPVVVPSMTFGGLEVRSAHARRTPVMDCHLALSLVQHGSMLTALGVRVLVVGGFHTERRARLQGRSLNILSRHALGLAVDVRAFVTLRGRTLTVLHHYHHPLVQRVEHVLTAAGGLRAVVTPGNDRAHRDHFHLSAKMTIDDAHPDPSVQVAELLAQTAPPARRYASLQAGPRVRPSRRALRPYAHRKH